MTLGEKIYELRTQHNLSQGDLANKLDVSRQSISKWENGNSTPDLEKIVKLAEIFNVSLDELIKNEEKETPAVSTPEQNPATQPNVREKKIGKGLLIAGVISIFVFLLLGLGITGFFVAIPLFACSIVLYKAKSNYSVWCLWAIISLADIFVHTTMGISWNDIKRTVLWEESWNYWRLAIAWVQFAVILFLIIFSIVKLSKKPYELNQKFKHNYMAAGIGFVLFEILPLVSSFILSKIVLGNSFGHIPDAIAVSISGFSGVFEWLKFYLLTDFVSKTIYIIKSKKSYKKERTKQVEE